MTTSSETIEQLASQEYKFGFVTDILVGGAGKPSRKNGPSTARAGKRAGVSAGAGFRGSSRAPAPR